MNREQTGRYIPRGNKSSASKRKDAMNKRFGKFKPECLFVADSEGHFCRQQPVASHTIPNVKVLDQIKGHDNKVLVMSWGLGAFSHLFMSSSEESPIDLTLGTFEPRPQGINSASTGRFACCSHERITFDPIDVAEPDFTDPEVLFLTEYRAYLYAHSLLLWGKWMNDEWNLEIMRGPNKAQRAGWLKKRDQIKQLLPQIETLVSRLGKLWHEKKRTVNIAPQVVSGKLFYFRSSLKFAACMSYGRSSALTVFPTGGDWHGMGITDLIEDESHDNELILRLVEVAEASRNEEGYSINVLLALHDVAAGVVAMSPDSYDLLSEGEQFSLGAIIASIANADMMTDMLIQ